MCLLFHIKHTPKCVIRIYCIYIYTIYTSIYLYKRFAIGTRRTADNNRALKRCKDFKISSWVQNESNNRDELIRLLDGKHVSRWANTCLRRTKRYTMYIVVHWNGAYFVETQKCQVLDVGFVCLWNLGANRMYVWQKGRARYRCERFIFHCGVNTRRRWIWKSGTMKLLCIYFCLIWVQLHPGLDCNNALQQIGCL